MANVVTKAVRRDLKRGQIIIRRRFIILLGCEWSKWYNITWAVLAKTSFQAMAIIIYRERWVFVFNRLRKLPWILWLFFFSGANSSRFLISLKTDKQAIIKGKEQESNERC